MAILYGLGLGPGDPELLTLKTARLIRNADVVCYIINAKGFSLGASIAKEQLEQAKPTQQHLPLPLEMNKDRYLINQQYDAIAEQIKTHLANGKNVAFLCEGDPFFFGSFIYLFERISPEYQVEVIPGVTSINAASAATRRPLTLLSESMAVLSGRSSDQEIRNALDKFDSVVLLKVASQRERLLRLIKAAGRSEQACYIEKASMPEQAITWSIDELSGPGPYFSLLLITNKRQGVSLE